MIQGILHLKEALIRAVDEEGFDTPVPTVDQFNLLAEVVHILEFIKGVSELMSADKVATMDRALVFVHRIYQKLRKYRSGLIDDSDIGKFLDALEQQLDKRFSKQGADLLPYAYGHLLHPFYKGELLKKLDRYETYVNAMIDRHPTTIQHLNAQHENDKSVERSEEEILMEEDECDLEKSILTQIKEKKVNQHHAPIKQEWLNFRERNLADSKVINAV